MKYQLKKTKNLLRNVLYDASAKGFKFTPEGHSTLLSDCFGIQLAYLLNDLSGYPTKDIAERIISQQDSKTGFFMGENFNYSDTTGHFEEEYFPWLFSYFAVISLDMIKENPKYSFNFLIKFKTKEYLSDWVEQRMNERFWYASNKLMFLLYFLTYEQVRLGKNNIEIINFVFDRLDNHQDSTTGYWGTKTEPLEHGMYGAAHIYMYYNYHNREIKFADKISTNTLNLFNEFGLFGGKYGGACEDYDAIEILNEINTYQKVTDIRYFNTLRKHLSVVLKHQHRDGGFSYRIDNRDYLRRLKKKYITGSEDFSYGAWNKMKANAFYESDLWSTYFRILSLAKIECILNTGDCKFNFYDLPGWGH